MTEMNNVVPINKFEIEANRVDPQDFSNMDVIDFMLAAGTHPSVTNDPQQTAKHILKLLPGDSKALLDEWQERASLLCVDASELGDDEYDEFIQDDIAKRALAIIRSKSGHYKGNEQIVGATRAIINLRAGIVLKYPELKDFKLHKWEDVLKNLGRVAAK